MNDLPQSDGVDIRAGGGGTDIALGDSGADVPVRQPVENPRKGILFMLLGEISISTYFVTSKYVLRGFDVRTFCLLWSASAACYALVVIAAMGRLKRLKLARRSIPVIAGMALSAGVGTVLLYSAIDRLEPAFAAFLARLQPALMIVMCFVILKERLRAVELAPMALLVGGGLVSVWGQWGTVGPGMLLMLISLAAFAVQRLLVKLETARVTAEVQVFYRGVGTMSVAAVWLLFGGQVRVAHAPGYWGVLFLGALMGAFMGNLLTFHAYRFWSLSRCTMIMMIEPLLVLPMAYFFLGTSPAPQQLAGGLVIFAGAAWLVWIHFFRGRYHDGAARP